MNKRTDTGRKSAIKADRDRLALSNEKLIEALQEFIDIDENRGGLFAAATASSDLVLALDQAKGAPRKSEGVGVMEKPTSAEACKIAEDAVREALKG